MTFENVDATLILEMVQNGELTPQQAEEWATTNTHPPFAHKPNPETFNVMGESQWTLPMAMAWFIWRSPAAVAETTQQFRQSWKQWSTVPPKEHPNTLGLHHWDLVPVGPPSIVELLIHPDLTRLPIDRLFDPAIWESARPWSPAVSSPFTRFQQAAYLESIKATAVAVPSDNAGKRVAFSDLAMFLSSSLREARRMMSKRTRNLDCGLEIADFQLLLGEYTDPTIDRLSDVRVSRDEVLLADSIASRLEYNVKSWTIEHALGWIAYRDIAKFRLLTPSGSAGRANEAQARRLGFTNLSPDLALLSALADGNLLARPSIEVMHLDIPNPIPTSWWHGPGLTDVPHIRFNKTDITTLWPGLSASESNVYEVGATTQTLNPQSIPLGPIDPWAPSENLTAGEIRVIHMLKRIWPDCECLLRVQDFINRTLTLWDVDRLGEPQGDKTFERALDKIPYWHAYRLANGIDRPRKP